MDTNKKINVIEDLSRYKDCLTIGRLKKFLEQHPELPDDSLVLTQRVEDRYYENNGWGVVLKEGHHYHMVKLITLEWKKKSVEERMENTQSMIWKTLQSSLKN